MLKALIIAFSTYSKIPMPSTEWKREDMKYSMCAFPFVGLVLAFIQYGAYIMLTKLGTGHILAAAILTGIPLLITGGIHMDGYMDTWDAICSYGDKDKKLEILKDPHVGAFAVIHCASYIMLTFALWHELLTALDEGGMEPAVLYTVLSGYVLSRILSGLYALTFKKAKEDGMLNDMTKKPDRKAALILIIMLIACAACALYLFRAPGAVMLTSAALVSLYYRYMSYKRFGGITGDLAGWFLQITELTILFFAAIIK